MVEELKAVVFAVRDYFEGADFARAENLLVLGQKWKEFQDKAMTLAINEFLGKPPEPRP